MINVQINHIENFAENLFFKQCRFFYKMQFSFYLFADYLRGLFILASLQ